jgi:hypothetical protein
VAEYSGIRRIASDGEEVLIYRLKKSRAGTEFRIADWFGNVTAMSREMHGLLHAEARKCGAAYITFSGAAHGFSGGFKVDKGPIVTIRDIQFSKMNDLTGFKNWEPSLGDLELF